MKLLYSNYNCHTSSVRFLFVALLAIGCSITIPRTESSKSIVTGGNDDYYDLDRDDSTTIMMTTTKLRGRHRHDHHEAEATARRNLVTSAATVVPTNVSAYFPPQIVDDCPRIDYLDLMLTNPVAIRNPVAAADLLGKDILEERISLILVCTSTAGTTSQPRRMTLEEVETAASVFVDLYNFQAGFGCDGSERIAINATYFDDDVLLFVPAVGANTMTFNMTGLCDGCVDGVTGLARPSFFSPPSSSLPNGGRTRHRRLRLHLHRNLESMKLLHDVLSLRAECACEEDALLALPPTFQHVVELVQTFLMFSTDCTLESANVVVLGQENDGDDDEECTGDSDCDGGAFFVTTPANVRKGPTVATVDLARSVIPPVPANLSQIAVRTLMTATVTVRNVGTVNVSWTLMIVAGLIRTVPMMRFAKLTAMNVLSVPHPKILIAEAMKCVIPPAIRAKNALAIHTVQAQNTAPMTKSA
eukprot:CAMPEP_0113442036 /NCGR_PEP_ID=MMETSP0014_2-20120614/1402_1 /TAXON_ID=2857 /ORGANISM="Nitzschia sp." /LENGTH=472 /DNA_ID=CAMNT_0000332921 /DNA_START=47 /DNA_END=1466 /DNA_ORIENTATION=+ /assembly_acc=CAM_ASM_000159